MGIGTQGMFMRLHRLARFAAAARDFSHPHRTMSTRARSEEHDSSGAAPDARDLTSADYYADSYAHFGIHEEMLKDTVRTETYMQAMLKNKHLFKDKVVLDVGCGTGILSMFAAKAGAKHVYGVDMSSIIESTRQIVKDNNLDNRITLIRGKVEEIDLPVEKVDIIVSEWMGYLLLYESMLDSVLVARDRWLTDDGVLLPDRATLYLCAIEDADYKAEKIGFWKDVYGFDMSAMEQTVMEEPLVDIVDGRAIVTSSCPVLTLDLNTSTIEDLTFSRRFEILAEKTDYVHALVAYFDVEFSAGHTPVGFSTSPMSPSTHWKQTVFYLEDELLMKEGERLKGVIDIKPNSKNNRDLDIRLSYEIAGKMSNCKNTQSFKLR